MVNYRPLGKTELEVSEIGFGTWTLTSGRWGAFSPELAVELLRYAYGQGVNYYDTSTVHAGGLGERLLATAFSGANAPHRPLVRVHVPNPISETSMSVFPNGR